MFKISVCSFIRIINQWPKLIVIAIICLGIMPHANAGSPKQKEDLQSIITEPKYSHLFQYYCTQEIAQVEGCIAQTFSRDKDYFGEVLDLLQNDAALRELSQLFSAIQLIRVLPYNIPDNAQTALQTKLDEIEIELPESRRQELLEFALEKDTAFGALGFRNYAILVANAALVGPEIGLDLVSGGSLSIFKGSGKVLRKGYKVKSISKISLALVKKKHLKEMSKSLLNVGPRLKDHVKNLKGWQKAAYKVFNHKGFRAIVSAINRSNDLANVVVEFTSEELQIIQEALDNQDALVFEDNVETPADDILVTYLNFLRDAIQGAIPSETGNQRLIAMFINAVHGGLVAPLQEDGLTTDENGEQTTLISIAEGAAKGASELVPIVGPIAGATYRAQSAAAKIDEIQKQSVDAVHAFNARKEKATNLVLNLYQLAIIENIAQLIMGNDRLIPSSINFQESFGVPAASNPIKLALHNADDTFINLITDDLYQCRIAYHKMLQGKTIGEKTTNPNFYDKNNQAIPNTYSLCHPAQGIYRLITQVSRGNIDRQFDQKIQLYVTLFDIKMYRLQQDSEFIDVPPTNVFYPYIQAMALQGKLSNKSTYFNPNAVITRIELLKLAAHAFYPKDPLLSSLHNANTDVEIANFYWFWEDKIGWSDNQEYAESNTFRYLIAELIYDVMDSELGLVARPGPEVLIPDASVRWTINDTTYNFKTNAGLGWTYSAAFLGATDISGGFSDGSFRPERILTRGEVAKMLFNASQFLEKNQ